MGRWNNGSVVLAGLQMHKVSNILMFQFDKSQKLLMIIPIKSPTSLDLLRSAQRAFSEPVHAEWQATTWHNMQLTVVL